MCIQYNNMYLTSNLLYSLCVINVLPNVLVLLSKLTDLSFNLVKETHIEFQ